MRYAFETMGTVVSVDADARPPAVEAVFHDLDARFSLYRPDSELSAIADGRVRLLHASAELKGAYALAVDWRERTAGAFTPHRPDGVLDLSGVVKALAIESAGGVLDAHGGAWTLGCGGDVLTRRPTTTTVGIAHPDARGRLLTALDVPPERRAIATSGSSERGEHIWRTGADDSLVQVTVLAGDIVTADVLATAIVAGGMRTCDLVTDAFDCDVLAIARDGTISATPGVRFAGHDRAARAAA